jgi:hypothetical protein
MPWNNYQRFRVVVFKKKFTYANTFRLHKMFFLCSTEFSIKDNIKICCDCFKIYHYKCTELTIIPTTI